MTPEPDFLHHPRNADVTRNNLLLTRLTIFFGLLAAATGMMGIIIARLSISLVDSANPDTKTIALSAALIWIFLGSILAYQAVKPLQRIGSPIIQTLLLLIAVTWTIEFVFSVQGSHFFIETLFVSAGTTVLGPTSTSISPAAAGLAVTAAIALMLVIRCSGISPKPARVPDAISILGLAISLVSITFVLSYVYGDPLLYGTQFIPIAFISALAALFTGVSIITSAGPDAVPVKYMIGSSTSTSLRRVFVPLVVGIILFENIAFAGLSAWFNIHDAVLLSINLVVFGLATAFVVSRVSGGMGRALEQVEQELVRKNVDLAAMNEELTAFEEELRQNIEELSRAEKTLRESEVKFRTVADFTSDWEFWCDPDGHYIYISPSAEKILGRKVSQNTPAEPFLREVMHPDDLDARLAHLKDELAGSGPYELEFRIIRADKEIRWLHHVCRPIRDANGKFLGTRGSNRDITNRKKAEDELIRKNDDLNALNEELTATQEELNQNIEELTRREHDLNKVLAEKEVLLSEIHHRVKNNLTAFISLLSLEGSTEDTPAGKMLKQDLQNRARSMALIHETLYRTHLYDEVNMGIYLSTLLDQIANSFRTTRPVKIVVEAHGIMLDIPRATPVGLIINELVTNSFKYAFPDFFDSLAVRNAPPTITIALLENEGAYEMTVKDNGVGLPPGYNLAITKTLGLKLVNFLAKHQLRASIEVRTDKGTEFIFRLNNIKYDA